ncbi:hypothetical protein BV898_13405 [Hypsibius exemplaris]|uniref:Intradiol ring-cleavage dioxygenases domain-containing protein n=1 Tax=Hypsibius exemplaris TaxID=2072580 RepID=A0A1W0WAW2_HYPEX|nr:hypothetical protein BV898_13405 [Hypsibius exemplaris]
MSPLAVAQQSGLSNLLDRRSNPGNGGPQQRQNCPLTSPDIEGPYYKPGAPVQRNSIATLAQVCKNNGANDRLILNGTIRQASKKNPCGTPVAAVLDIWHANADGVYSDRSRSSSDFTCRMRLMTDPDGTFVFSSIFPGRYDDGGFRPAHIHFQITPQDDRIDARRQRPFTTQMYFAQDQFLNPHDSCGICASGDPTLITHVSHQSDIKTFVGTWDVLLAGNN